VDVRQFLASVVPWPSDADPEGYVTINWQRPDRKWPGRSCRTIEDALKIIAEIGTQPNNVFFCLSCQRENGGKRSKENAKSVRSLWVDLDVDPDDPNKYPSVAEAIADLFTFCLLLEIPRPSVVVLSGGGVHAYWISDVVLTVDEWLPFANALKSAAKASTLKIDAAVTADVSRVLRVPDTMNYKYDPPREVRLMQSNCNGVMHDFKTVFATLLEQFPSTESSAKKFKIDPAFKDMPVDHLGESIDLGSMDDMPVEPVLEGCGWLREAYETGGKTFDNPQWNCTTLIATWLKDGQKLAHKFAEGHPEYVYAKTEKEWERKNDERARNPKIGWPGCEHIKDIKSKHCDTCEHFGKIKSPLNLATAALKEEKEDREFTMVGLRRPPEMMLPRGYGIDRLDRICAFSPSRVGGKGEPQVVPPKVSLLFLTQLSKPTFFLKDGKFGVSLIATTEKDGLQEVYLTSEECLKGKLVQHFQAKFVLCTHEKGTEEMTVKLMSSWLNRLREGKADRDPGTMGWRYTEGKKTGFAYGTKVYHQDGKETSIIGVAGDTFRSWYMPVGSREVWIKACKLLTDRKRPQLDCIIALAFAAPLADFTGTIYGAILCIWGEPGTAKSTAQQVAAALWGHPKQTRESLNSTSKSVLSRLGRTRNLPGYWDDVQDERHLLNLFDTLFIAAEGAEGGRLNPDASYKQRMEWQTLLVVCANASFVEYLLRKQKSTTAGIRRVFEIEFNKMKDEPGMINPVTANTIFGELVHNYGVVGSEYAKILATEHPQIGELVIRTVDEFRKEVKGEADEVYWWGMCGVLLVGAQMANRLGADIDLINLREFLIVSFKKNRELRATEGTEGGSYDNTERALTGFLNRYVGGGNALFVDHVTNRKDVKVDLQPLQGREVFIQIATNERILVLSKRALKKYLYDEEIQSRQVFLGLAKFFEARETKRTLGAGTPHAQTQEHCFEIAVPENKYEILEDLMQARGTAVAKLKAKAKAEAEAAKSSV
jgi:Domain of unknown function (DUF927)